MLLVRRGGCKSALDLRMYDRPLCFRIERATRGLCGPKANHSAGHILTRRSRLHLAGFDRLGIVQRRDRIPERSYRDAVTFPHRGAELLTQADTQVPRSHSMIIAQEAPTGLRFSWGIVRSGWVLHQSAAQITTCHGRSMEQSSDEIDIGRRVVSTLKPSVAEKFAEHIAYHRPLAEIEETAADMGSSPSDAGIVEMIVCRPAVNERRVLQEGVLDATHGLRGDSWESRGVGTPAGSADPLRQITVMNSRVLASVAGHRDRWQLAGDQLIVDFNLSIDSLAAGTRLQIGEAVAEVTEPPHTGCSKFAGRFGAEALAWANGPVGRRERRRGMHVRVLKSGTVRTGDVIRRIA